MADYNIGALIAGTGGITPPKFDFQSAIGDLPKAYWEGQDQQFKQQQRDAFKEGLPKLPDGSIDWNAVSQTVLSKGGTSGVGPAVEIGKMLTQQNLIGGLQGMSGNVFGGSSPMPPSSATATSAAPVRSSAPLPAPNDPTMTVSPRQVQAANPPIDVPVTPNQRVAQAPQPPQVAPSAAVPAISPELEAELRASGRLPQGRTLAQHIGLLQRAASLAQTTGVRDAGKTYLDAIDSVMKFIEQRNAPTDKQKDYEMARRQGYRGTFDDWTSEKEAKEARIAVDKDTVKEIGAQAAQVNRVRPLLDEALRLSANAPGGYAGTLAPYWAKVMSGLGLPVNEKISNAEALRSIAQQLVPLVRQPGATSNYEAQLYLDAVISPGLSNEGRVKVGNMIVKMVDRSLQVAQIYRSNIGNPNLYDKIAALDGKPIFTPKERALLEGAARSAKDAAAKQDTLQTFKSTDEARRAGVKKFLTTDGRTMEIP